MADRGELLESALDVYPEGLALLDQVGRVVFWNRAAETITGHCSANLVGRELPQALEPLMCCGVVERSHVLSDPQNSRQLARGTLVHAQHRHGHDVPAVARRVILRDVLGARIGTATVFHPAERTHALPHGDTTESCDVRESQAELRDRLQSDYAAFVSEAAPLGLLWIMVDQGQHMRRTHGAQACETMLENVERTLANHLRCGDQIGRWGDDEFLVLAHEARDEGLAEYGQELAGIARTADFRWWGDRIALSVSIGVAEAARNEPLAGVLDRARAAMQTSYQAGGNHVTLAAGRLACMPS